MIIGAHSIIYSANPEADRGFFRDVLKLTNVDVGDGWLIFGLPPAEVAVHSHDKNDMHELYLMCEDVQAFVAAMLQRSIACDPPQDQGWGVLTRLTLPGGGKLGVYQPRHARPSQPMTTAASASKPAKKRPAKKPAKRTANKPTRRVAKAASRKKKVRRR